MVSRAPKGRSKATNGKQLFLEGDARFKVSRRFRDVLASIATDLGGADRLSEGQKQIARRCAMLSVECEIMESAAVAGEPFDLDVYGQLTDRLGSRLSAAWPRAGHARRDAGPRRLLVACRLAGLSSLAVRCPTAGTFPEGQAAC
jgi:hypothetical protein